MSSTLIRRRRWRMCSIVFFAMVVLGCEPHDSQQLTDTKISLQLGDKSTFDSLLQEKRGKIVLVDFWATWCAPCIQQFPHTVELGDRYRAQGLHVIAVSMNEPSDRTKVLEFLKRSKADGVSCLLTEYGAGSAFVEAFDLRGDIPFYRLYDRKGALRYSFSDEPEGIPQCEPIKQIDERVRELLEEEVSDSQRGD